VPKKRPANAANTHKERLDFLWQVTEDMAAELHLSDIFQSIVNLTAKAMDSKICSLMILDEAQGTLAIAATQALGPDYINKPPVKIKESLSGLAIAGKKPLIIADVRKDKRYQYPEIAAREGLVSLLSVPMMKGGKATGVINSYTSALHSFVPEEVKLLQAVANLAAVAIENTKLRSENSAIKEALAERKKVEQAKTLLMRAQKLTEEEAYRRIQKMSRDHRKSMGEIAAALLLALSPSKSS
jgi:signal transduction protein with GAF and PtsI domain